MAVAVFHLQVPACARSLRVLRACVRSALDDVPEREASRIVLAVDEACANIVKHREKLPGRNCIQLDVERDGDLVRFRLGGFCAQRDVSHIQPRDLADVRPGGLGTHFIDQIMDRVAYEPDSVVPGHMDLVLEKRCSREEAE